MLKNKIKKNKLKKINPKKTQVTEANPPNLQHGR